MFGYTQDAKANSYRALVRACLEYVCAVWTPYTAHDINLLDSVQNRAALWIKNYWDLSILYFTWNNCHQFFEVFSLAT